MKKSLWGWFVISVVCLSLVVPSFGKTVHAMTVLETDVATASDGCTMLGVYGSYYSQAQDALNRINEIRKEACEAGDVPDPRDTSRMLTPSDYVPIKWSTDLESVARIRAMEGGLAYSFMGSGHNRLNGKAWYSVTYNGVSSSAEDLAYNWGTSMVSGINQWYGEKEDWVNQVSGAVTGHYTSMINPSFTYVGLGDFYTEEAVYPNTLAGEFCRSSQELDQTMQVAQNDVMQKIEVKTSYITGYTLDGVDTIYTDGTTTLTPRVNLQNGSKTHKLWVLDSVTYTSSDTAVATVNDAGVVTGVKNGKTTITAKSGNNTLATVVITVKCNHAKELVSETPSTCTSTGLKVYSCDFCGESVEQEVPKMPHNYVYSEADSEGYCTGICSACGDTINIIPPTTYTVWWRNSTSDSYYYWNSFPSSNPIGSTIYCWLDGVDGDSGYQDMVIESSDESVISVPDNAVANSSNNQLKVLAPGITTITIYPKYNASLKKTVVARIGDSGSVDITSADVTLTPFAYEYTGKACTPTVSVSYHDTTLQKGTDYTVTYENNVEIGTATVVITGNGIFAGTIRKDFTIGHMEHVHNMVYQEAVAAVCESVGNVAYYVCDGCGNLYDDELGNNQITLEETIIEALGHSWEDFYTIDVPATATTSGSKSIHCRNCNATKEVTVIPATGDAGNNDAGNDNAGNDDGGHDDGDNLPVEEEPATGDDPKGDETTDNGNNPSGDEDTKLDDENQEDLEDSIDNSDTDDEDEDSLDETYADEEDDTDEEEDYLDVGDTFKIKGITYEVVKSDPDEWDFEVSCVKTSSKKITVYRMPSEVSYDDVSYQVVSVGKNTFSGCKKLKTLSLGSNVTTIGDRAFYKCSALTEIAIPSKVTKIGKQAFAGCKKLKTITIKSKKLKESKIGQNAFKGIKSKATIEVPKKKYKAYKKMLKKKGVSTKATFKKI